MSNFFVVWYVCKLYAKRFSLAIAGLRVLLSWDLKGALYKYLESMNECDVLGIRTPSSNCRLVSV